MVEPIRTFLGFERSRFVSTMEGRGEEGEPLQSDALVKMDKIVEDEELRSLLIPDVKDLPSIPPSAVESNFVRYYAAGTP